MKMTPEMDNPCRECSRCNSYENVDKWEPGKEMEKWA